MDEEPIDEITPVAQDYLKVIWSATEWGGAPITTTALARRFGTSAASVTDAVKRLAAQGYLDHTPYRPVALTAEGERLAVAMVRRHRLVETFLVETLDYGWDEVHKEAERLEHAVSDRLLERMDRMLGHPAADPHGDPIPDRDGAVARRADAVLLADALPGEYTVLRISDADAGVLDEAAAIGLAPGAVVEVYSGARIRVAPAADLVTLTSELAAAVRIAPMGPGPDVASQA